EGPHGSSAHDGVQTVDSGAGNRRGRLVHARKRRRIAIVDRTLAFLGFLPDPRDVLRRMKPVQLLLRRHMRIGDRAPLVEPALHRFLPEGILPVGAPRVAVREAIPGQGLSYIERNFVLHKTPAGCFRKPNSPESTGKETSSRCISWHSNRLRARSPVVRNGSSTSTAAYAASRRRPASSSAPESPLQESAADPLPGPCR